MPTEDERRLTILESIAGNSTPLATLSEVAEMAAGEGSAAIYVSTGDSFKLSASAGRYSAFEPHLPWDDALASRPPHVEERSLVSPSAGRLPTETHPLISGAGEVLGLLAVCTAGLGPQQAEIQAAARLAVIAIEQANLIAELSYSARHDALTGLLNRTSLEEQTLSAFRAARENGNLVGLLYVGLDRFRLVNDFLGHSIADQALRLAANRIRMSLRDSDIAARAGGDEFLLLLPGMKRPEEALFAATRVVELMNQPIEVAGNELWLTASIGVATSSGHQDPAAMQRHAYTALHYAKMRGRNRVEVHTPSMNAFRPERMNMERLMRSAIERGQLLLYYQPQISLSTRALAGAEALIRWRHPDLGIVSPEAFIPVAEETGLILEFGDWAIAEAARQAARWAPSGRIRIGVNASALQFDRPDFAATVMRAIEASGAPPSTFDMELTESVVVRDMAHTISQMKVLAEAGVRFSLDDFGTGHSSLAYMSKLPIQALKIDQSFVREVTQSSDRPPILTGVVRLAREMNLETIAEGIETEAQMEALTAIGCDIGQGFGIGKPMAATAFEEWRARNLAKA